jgi:hypothetical protein
LRPSRLLIGKGRDYSSWSKLNSQPDPEADEDAKLPLPSRTRYLLDIVQTGIHLLDSYLIDIFAVVKCHLLKISSLRHVRDSKLIKYLLLLMPS